MPIHKEPRYRHSLKEGETRFVIILLDARYNELKEVRDKMVFSPEIGKKIEEEMEMCKSVSNYMASRLVKLK